MCSIYKNYISIVLELQALLAIFDPINGHHYSFCLLY